MQERIAIIGSGGMLGRALSEELAGRGAPVTPFSCRAAVDVADSESVARALDRVAPNVVINASGYTDIDGAEADPDAAFRVNRDGPATLAGYCRRHGALLVHFSSDYVFGGTGVTPYAVDAETSPVNTYGHSKLAGEERIRASGVEYLIIRSSWLFAPFGHNFVRSILERAAREPVIDVVADQVGRPTCARILAEMTGDFIEEGARGTFHAANDGACSWDAFAAEIVKTAGFSCRISPRSSAEQGRPAARPAYGVLDLDKTIELIGRPEPWRTAVRACVAEILAEGEVMGEARRYAG